MQGVEQMVIDLVSDEESQREKMKKKKQKDVPAQAELAPRKKIPTRSDRSSTEGDGAYQPTIRGAKLQNMNRKSERLQKK